MFWLLAAVALLWGTAWLGRRLLGRTPRTESAPSSPDALQLDDPEPIGDQLDLHGVAPHEVGELVDAFVDAACERGFRWVLQPAHAQDAAHHHKDQRGNQPRDAGQGAQAVIGRGIRWRVERGHTLEDTLPASVQRVPKTGAALNNQPS